MAIDLVLRMTGGGRRRCDTFQRNSLRYLFVHRRGHLGQWRSRYGYRPNSGDDSVAGTIDLVVGRGHLSSPVASGGAWCDGSDTNRIRRG